MQKIFIALALLVVLSIAGLAIADAAMSQYLTALISLTALVVSIASAFKEDLFPFRPKAIYEEVVLAATTAPSHDSAAILLPIAFLNQGHGSGIIEGLTLKVEAGANAKIYTPVAEVDMQKFLNGKRALHAENLVGAFNLFPLSPRQSLKKFILFSQEEHSKQYPFSAWSAGQHKFRLYVKHTASSKPVEMCCIELNITQEILSNYKQGTTASLGPSRELQV